MSSKLCLEIPQPLFEVLSGISRKLNKKPEELIVKALQQYVEIASEIDRIYMESFSESCENGEDYEEEFIAEIGEEEKIEKLREVLGKYRSFKRWLK